MLPWDSFLWELHCFGNAERVPTNHLRSQSWFPSSIFFHNTNLRCILEKIVLPTVNGSSSKRFLKTQGLFPNAYTFIPEDFLRIFVLFLLTNEGLVRKYSLKPFLLSIVEAYFSTPSMPFNLKAFVSTYSLYDFTQLNMLIQTIC